MKMPTFTEETCSMRSSHPALLRKGRACMCGYNKKPDSGDGEEIVVEIADDTPARDRVDTVTRSDMAKTDKEAS